MGCDRNWPRLILIIGISLGGLCSNDERAAAAVTDGGGDVGAIAPNPAPTLIARPTMHTDLDADCEKLFDPPKSPLKKTLLANYLLTFPDSQALPAEPLLEALPPVGLRQMRRQSLQSANPRLCLGSRTQKIFCKIIRQQHLKKGDFERVPPFYQGGLGRIYPFGMRRNNWCVHRSMARRGVGCGMWSVVNANKKSDQFHPSADLLLAAPENLNPGLRLPPPPPPAPLLEESPDESPSPSSPEPVMPGDPWLVLENLQLDFRNDTDNFDQLKRLIEPTVRFRLPNDNLLSVATGLNTFEQPGVESITNIPLQIGWEGALEPFTLKTHAGVEVFDRLSVVPTFDASATVTVLPNVTVSASVEHGPYKFNAETLDNQITTWRYGPDLFWQINDNTSLFSLLRFGQYNDGNFEQQSFSRLEHRLGQLSVAANLFNWSYQKDAEITSGYFSPPDFLVFNGEIAWEEDVFDFLNCRFAGNFGNQRLQGAWTTAYSYQARCTAQLSPQIEADFGYAFSNVRSRTGGSAFNTEGLSGQLRVSF